MYNLRYHVASLVGVFLALALGLVLGGLVVQRGTVGRQQATLVESLREEFATLRTDNEELTADNELLTSFSADMSDAWTADKLVGRNVMVMSGAGRASGLAAATEALKQAGGNPVSLTLSKPDLGLADATLRSKVSSAPGDELTDEIVTEVAKKLAAEWTTPMATRPVTEALVDAGVMTVEGFDPGMVIASVVDLAAVGGTPDAGALAVAVAFDRTDSPAVAAEAAATKTGVAAAGAERDLAALDSLGTPVGGYTLVALLSGAERGFYGFGPGTVAQYPVPPTK